MSNKLSLAGLVKIQQVVIGFVFWRLLACLDFLTVPVFFGSGWVGDRHRVSSDELIAQIETFAVASLHQNPGNKVPPHCVLVYFLFDLLVDHPR